jgi:hypothetical protein
MMVKMNLADNREFFAVLLGVLDQFREFTDLKVELSQLHADDLFGCQDQIGIAIRAIFVPEMIFLESVVDLVLAAFFWCAPSCKITSEIRTDIGDQKSFFPAQAPGKYFVVTMHKMLPEKSSIHFKTSNIWSVNPGKLPISL